MTILGLIVSFISSEKEVTAATYWLAVIFTALVAVGALIEWGRSSKPEASPPTPAGPKPPHRKPVPPRTTRSVLAGAVSGLVASVLFFLMIGPGSHGSTTAPEPPPTVTATPRSTPPTSGPAPTASSPAFPGQPITVRVTPGDGGTQFSDDMTVT